MSLLSIVQNVAAAVNTTIPTSIVGNPNADARQWLILAQRSLSEVARRHDWQILVNQHLFVATATGGQAGGLPTFFDHFVPDVVVMNNDTGIPLNGPIPDNVLVTMTNFIGEYWGIVTGQLFIIPTDNAGVTYVYHYVTGGVVIDANLTTERTTWAVDTDTSRVPEDMIELHLTWRWLRAHGMDYAEEMATYEREVERAAARDRGLHILTLDRRGGGVANWPGTIVP